MAFWGPILGSVVGVLGGSMIARQQQKAAESAEARNQQYLEQSKLTDLSKLRESAEKAGFNPLTALRSGAGNFQANTAIMPSMSGYKFAVESLSQGVNSAVSYAETYKERALDALLKTYQIQSMAADISLTQGQLKALGQKPKQDRPMDVPLIGSDGKQVYDDEGQPLFMQAQNQDVVPMWIPIRNPMTNKVLGYPNPDLADMGPAEFATFMGLTTLFEKHANDGTGFTWKGIGVPAMPRFDFGVKVQGDNGQLSWPKSAK